MKTSEEYEAEIAKLKSEKSDLMYKNHNLMEQLIVLTDQLDRIIELQKGVDRVHH